MDQLSVHSLSSDNASSEFEEVPTPVNSSMSSSIETGLQIAGNGNETDLQQQLKEVIESEAAGSHIKSEGGDTTIVESPSFAAMTNSSYLEEDCILFNGIYYLGCSSVNAPRSEAEAQRTIKILREQQNDTRTQIEVVLSVPSRADGTVRLLEPNGASEIANFCVYKILFCVRGLDNSNNSDCFAFTESHKSSGIFQCHVFRCDMPEAVKKVLYSFDLAFRSIPKVPPAPINTNVSTGSSLLKKSNLHLKLQNQNQSSGTMLSPSSGGELTPVPFDETLFCFNVSLEIKEDDGKGGYGTVPWDKASSCFKLRQNLEKKVIVIVTQTVNVELTVERCFGLLLTPGRNVQDSDMHLLDMESMTSGQRDAQYKTQPHIITGVWDPTQAQFQMLNTETQKGTRVFMSIAVDLVVQEMQEPVRLLIETKARVFQQHEKFWYFGKKVLQETFYLKLSEIEDVSSKQKYRVIGLESQMERDRRGSTWWPVVSGLTLSSSSRQDEEDDDDTDEPLLSGSGEVSKECSADTLSNWADVLARWRSDFKNRPSALKLLVRNGIPDALRGEVWQLLAGCHDNLEMLEEYRILITKESPQDNIIQRDIHRTFPAHDFFKAAGGEGQDSLYKISKAYSVYDIEVGYCQGLSFLAAALLLHMPEEQAFCVLCKVMYEYKMRDLFKNGFETLHLKFYQLERAIEDLMPELCDHFKQLGIETHMYSSQWFLTLFTAKFPLNMVFQVVDLFLSEGQMIIFKVALGLLKSCRRDLLTLDFEGILKYFRVQLPKKYRLDDSTRGLVHMTVNIKLTEKKLKRYEKEYLNQQEQLSKEDPHIILERDNRRLMEANMRLEAENDDVALELINLRITLDTQLEKTMQQCNRLQHDLTLAVGELRTTRAKVQELNDENQRILLESAQSKELCRREMERQEDEIAKKSSIVDEYKTITSQLSMRIEQLQKNHANKDKDSSSSSEPPKQEVLESEHFKKIIRNLELQLAETKLSLVESECKVQELEHQLMSALRDLQSSKNTWFSKISSTLKPKDGAIHQPSSNIQFSNDSSLASISQKVAGRP